MCGHLMAVVPARPPREDYAGDPVPEGFEIGCFVQLAITAMLAAIFVWMWVVFGS